MPHVPTTPERLLVLCLALLAWAAPAAAVESPAPDSSAIARLDRLSRRGWTLQFVLGDQVVAARRARLDDDGVTLVPKRERPALLELGPKIAPAAARHIPWSDVQRVETVGSQGGKGFAIGFIVGAAGTATLVALAGGPDLFERGDGGALLLGTTFTIATSTVGFLLGLTVPSTKTVWP